MCFADYLERWGLNRLNLNALERTETELSDIAAAARIGSSRGPLNKNRSSPAATGIPAVLYANAQNRFCFILRIVLLLSCIAVGTSMRSLRISTMSADSIATSVPEPIAIPMSACARAGASLIPSPTIATFRFSTCNFFTSFDLSCGNTSAST